jgi:hypothetical protein
MKSILSGLPNETSSDFQKSSFNISFPKSRLWLQILVLLDAARLQGQRAIGESELGTIESSTKVMTKRRPLEYSASDIGGRHIGKNGDHRA